MKTLVVALGGNALLQRGEALTAENQYRNIASAVPALARLARSYRLAIVHGNGPQVGLLALQNLAWKEVEPYPLDVLVAESQGMIGYMLAQSLSAQPQMPPVTTVLTRIECIDSLEVRKKPGGHWIIRDLMGLDLVGLASL